MRARLLLLALVTTASLLAAMTAACFGGAVPAPTPRRTATAVATASTARPVAARLPDARVEALLRRAVCWLDDPTSAGTCVPPSPDALAAIDEMGRSGDPRLVAPLIDMLNLDLSWRGPLDAALVRLTGEQSTDARGWREWLLGQGQANAEGPPGYARWKARLLALTATPETKPTYEALFGATLDTSTLAALHWTGVQPDANRPLHDPANVNARAQRYLPPTDLVYGVVIGSEARAYPQRIIAWHGVVNDTLNGHAIVVVHCLPCGGAVAFERGQSGGSTAAGKPRDFGTTGLALHSRSLIFDTVESRLWDGFSGVALGGPGSPGSPRAALTPLPVFTTTWSDWQARHTTTTVLDIATGVVRDYSAGAATRDEVDSTRALHPVQADTRLAEKEPVIGVVPASGPPLAFRLAEVQTRQLVTAGAPGAGVVALSEGPGLAAGVYAAGGVHFVRAEGNGSGFAAIDDAGGRWAMREQALVQVGTGKELPALPWQQGYWFAWAGAHPETEVVRSGTQP
ncbi:MAG: DUF3179 domain-containing protein [Chloroflexi bacterium]|nr:MAG: DUF3179 domain-containing protein [Chloroflexota bacterium]